MNRSRVSIRKVVFRRGPLSSSAGFSMMEMVVTIAIMAVLAAVIAVETTPQLPASRAAALNQSLSGIKGALGGFYQPPGGGTGIGQYPDSLTKLVRPLTNAVDLDVCGNEIPNTSNNYWAGPYLLQHITSAGIPVGSSVIMPRLIAVAATASDPANIRIEVSGVDSSVVAVLEKQLDVGNTGAALNYASGNILWDADPKDDFATSSGSGRGTLYYSILFSGC